MDIGRFSPPFTEAAVEAVVRGLSPAWLKEQRWFGGKSRQVTGVWPAGYAMLDEDPPVALALARVGYSGEADELYTLALRFHEDGLVSDGLEDAGSQRLLFHLLATGAMRNGVRFEQWVDLPADGGEPRLLGVEQSNTSIVYGQEWLLKLYRRVEPGPNRDLEMGRFLSREASFAHTPEVAGRITYRDQAGLGVLQRFIPNEGDGWDYVPRRAAVDLTRVPNAPDDVYWAQDGLPDGGHELLEAIEALGRVTGEMHRALASRADLPLFAPEACSTQDVDGWLRDLERQRSTARKAAEDMAAALPGATRRLAESVLADGRAGRILIDRRPPAAPPCRKIQIHGDYHLGQVLRTGGGQFMIIDFEGEPARTGADRWAKHPPERDVAGMLRSLSYAAWTARAEAPDEIDEAAVEAWRKQATQRFLTGWETAWGLPADTWLLAVFQVTKAFYELTYELNHRPAWAEVPLRGIAELTSELTS